MSKTNILSVDVEEWFHPEAVQHNFPIEIWNEQESRVERNVEYLLDLFAEKQATATFFTLGWVAEQHPGLIRKIVNNGHEIASHGYSHQMITKMTPEIFRKDTDRSIKVLEDISGQKVLGFRAPTFSIVEKTFWAWEIMLDLGLKYDSSVYPIWHDRYGVPNAPRAPYIAYEKNGESIIEFPMSTLKFFGKNIPFGGGGYLRIFPGWLTKASIKTLNKKEKHAIVYVHPWEFDTLQPEIKLTTLQNWRHYYNIKNNLRKLAEILDLSDWTSFKNVFENNLAEFIRN